MKLNPGISRSVRAFTLVELMVAMGIGLLVMAAVMTFLWWSGLGMSGVTSQTILNQEAGNTLEFIQNRARLAVAVSNDASGNTLTLAFDDDPTTDSDSDGVPWNDRNHFERFQFVGVNGVTNNCSSNKLVYIPNIANAAQETLIPSGVRNLPGYHIFSVTNTFTTIIRFGLKDSYTADRYQSIDIQATALLLNRSQTTNIVAIIP